MKQDIQGTIMFDGAQAQKGYALNKMCFSFNDADNRAAFLRDEDAYCANLRPDAGATRRGAAAATCWSMIEAGGNVYYLAKLAGIFGLNVQDIGAQQTGMIGGSFKAKLAGGGEIGHGTDRRRRRHLPRSVDRQRDRQGLAARPLLEAVLRRVSAGA